MYGPRYSGAYKEASLSEKNNSSPLTLPLLIITDDIGTDSSVFDIHSNRRQLARAWNYTNLVVQNIKQRYRGKIYYFQRYIVAV